MTRSTARTIAVVLLIVLAVGVGGVLLDEARHIETPDRATVTFTDGDTTLGSVNARVAASYREKLVGLSLTDSLGPNEGMLFVHERPGTHEYVMRGMSFPIDIVFVAENGSVTRVHHADADGSDGPYRGYAKWVLEVPHNWTREHDVGLGDHAEIEWGDG